MSIWNTQLDRVGPLDISRLVAEAESEGRHLDFKESAPGSSDRSDDDFLGDIVAFANASGGDLVFGVRELRDDAGRKTGIAESISGLSRASVDEEILRIEHRVRDSTEPAVRVQCHEVSDPSWPGSVLIVRVAPSWNGPHMLKGKPRFYVRGSRGNQPMDVYDIRRAILQSEGRADAIRRLRDDRLSRIMTDELPVRVTGGPRAVVHLIPVGSVATGARHELPALKDATGYVWRPFAGGYSGPRPTLEGVAFYAAPIDGVTDYLAQIFRSGAAEVIWAGVAVDELQPERWIAAGRFEEGVICGARDLWSAARSLGVEPPAFVFVTLIACEGYRFIYRPGMSRSGQTPLQRDVLVLPECLLETTDADFASLLQPILDVAWNAVGMDRSPYYGSDGKRIEGATW